MDVCLRVLKESNKSSFDSLSVRNSVLIISHIITFWGCHAHIFSVNVSRKSCSQPVWLIRKSPIVLVLISQFSYFSKVKLTFQLFSASVWNLAQNFPQNPKMIFFLRPQYYSLFLVA